MTGDVDILLAAELVRAGAFDFIEKPWDERIFISAVLAALGSPDALQADLALRAETLAMFSKLTAQERDILNGIVAGRTNEDIGHDLALSARNVASYRANIMSKLDASSLSDVIRKTLIFEGTRRFRSIGA
jgi:two-component system response regulator FixJ